MLSPTCHATRRVISAVDLWLQILLCWNNEGGFLNTLAPRAEKNVGSSRGAKLHFLWTNAMCATAACAHGSLARCRRLRRVGERGAGMTTL